MREKVLLWTLLATYVVLEVANRLSFSSAPWLRTLGQWAELPLGMLLWLLVSRAENLVKLLRDVEDAKKELLQHIERTAELTQELHTTKEEVESMRHQLRVSDRAVHGKVLFYHGKYEEAASIFQHVVNAEPEEPHSRFWLGLSLLRAERPEEAFKHLSAAAQAIKDPEYLRAAGEAAFRLRMPQAAEQYLEQALQAGIRNREETLLLLAKAQRQFDKDRAKKTLQQVISRNLYNANAVVELAEILIDEGHYGAAIDICDDALGVHPQNWCVYPLRAKALLARGQASDEAQAYEDLRRAEEGNPKDRNIYMVWGADLVTRALKTTDSGVRNQLLAEAVEVYQRGLRQITGGHQAPLHAALAFAYLAKGDPASAEQAASNAVNVFPGHIENHLVYCAALLAGKRWLPLMNAAQGCRAVGGSAGRIYSYIYEVFGALFSGMRLSEVKNLLEGLLTEIGQNSEFVPRRREWVYIRQAVFTGSLRDAEANFVDILRGYLDGGCNRAAFMNAVQAALQQAVPGFSAAN